ncbi:MAG: nicotinic acid mononucleotide adenylyltransferase, partial [Planctomycetota bacterium]
VDHFQKTAGEETEVCWIIGADSLPELPAWHRAGELVERCRILTAARRGGVPIDWSKLGETFTPAQVARLKAGVLQTPVIEISSTDIRRRIAGGRSIRNLVPEAVRTYIKRHGLYRCETPSA